MAPVSSTCLELAFEPTVGDHQHGVRVTQLAALPDSPVLQQRPELGRGVLRLRQHANLVAGVGLQLGEYPLLFKVRPKRSGVRALCGVRAAPPPLARGSLAGLGQPQAVAPAPQQGAERYMRRRIPAEATDVASRRRASCGARYEVQGRVAPRGMFLGGGKSPNKSAEVFH
eukprot:scaffold126996_cov69-Phaeocystis_antarctica.AAC.2